MSLSQLVNIGDSAVMLPVAGAIAACLTASHAWKPALFWSVIFVSGLTVVALSKIVFLGWGIGIPRVEFQALSGHAFRVTAVIPVFFFVMLQPVSKAWQKRGVAAGIAASFGIDLLLIYFRFHSFSEVVASTILGLVVCLSFMRVVLNQSFPFPGPGNFFCGVFAVITIVLSNPSSFSNRVVDIALFFSGRDRPHEWINARAGHAGKSTQSNHSRIVE